MPGKVILLTKGYVAIVSSADYRRVKKYKWHLHRSKGKNRKPGRPYARAGIKGKKVLLHRFITGAELPIQVDHLNHQTLDCRRENLEDVDNATNQARRRNVNKKKNNTRLRL